MMIVMTSLITLLITICCVHQSLQFAGAPMIRSVIAPRYLMSGSETVLQCDYQYHNLPYSVRWYKNGKEFYSFVGDKTEPRSVHWTPGVVVDTERSGPRDVILTSVNLASTGRYRCEVSGQAPMFATDTKFADLTVVQAPDSGPDISGDKPSYHVGDKVNINCTVSGSSVAANITWYINNQMVRAITISLPFEAFPGSNQLHLEIMKYFFFFTLLLKVN